MKNSDLTIDIVDYGIGNIGSVARMIEKSGGIARRITSPKELINSTKIILPGVGNFDHGMSQLISLGWVEILDEKVMKNGIPLLGICLGMQLLCNKSEEGIIPGLGFIDADVVKFKDNYIEKLKIPNMGWRDIHLVRENPLFNSSIYEERFYFVHSFFVDCKDTNITIASSNYGIEFCAAFQSNNIFGVQFHPEKSHRFGMELLKRFIGIKSYA
jgi:glutamine amidotransferase